MLNKKVESEIAIGIIFITATVMGGLIWFQNSNIYASPSETRDSVHIDETNQIVFLGDSIIAQEDWNALLGVSYIGNAGISGNTTNDVIARVTQAVLYKPKKLFLMIGINDLLRGQEVSYVLANYEIILNKIKLQSPDTVVYIQSVLPINDDILKVISADSQKIIELNKKLKLFADKNNVFFIDLYPSFCGADNKLYNKYTNDGLHLGYYGYMAWKNIIVQYVQ